MNIEEAKAIVQEQNGKYVYDRVTAAFALIEGWNQCAEKAASLTESSFVEHEGYPFRLEDKLRALKHKEPEKQI